MKLVRANENKKVQLGKGTYDRVAIQVSLIASALNTALSSDDFDPSKVTIKVLYQRSKSEMYTLMNDNLKTLGIYYNLKHLDPWKVGTRKIIHAVDKKEELLLCCDLPFGHINIADGETLTVEVTVQNQGAFTVNIDEAKSYVAFDFTASIGYMRGIYETFVMGVEANQKDQKFALGDNVVNIMLLNTNKTTYESQVVTKLDLNSDRFNASMTWDEIYQNHLRFFPDYRFQKAAVSTFPAYPQSLILIDGAFTGKQLDDVNLTISYNNNEDLSQSNYLVYTRYTTNLAIINSAQNKSIKHMNEFLIKNRF